MKFSAIAYLGALSITRTHAFSPSIKFQTTSYETATRSLSIGPLSAAEEEKTDEATALEAKSSEPSKTSKIEPPKPFIPAMDPMYSIRGEIGNGNFLLSRGGGPTMEELSNENLIKIVLIECSDLEVNTLVWKCLGYRFNGENETWTNDEVFPNWREKYPTPPDLIGMQRIYTKEIDGPSLKSNQQLVKSVPVESKQSLKKHLKPLGFKGYQYAELTPNKTRRAQCANWLLYYREELFGFTVEELKERRRLKLEAEEAEKKRVEKELNDPPLDEWKPPVKEVF